MQTLDLSIHSLHQQYSDGKLTPASLVDYVLARCQEFPDHHIWINLLTRQQLSAWLDKLRDVSADSLPLYGIPFAIKDNIDLAGIPTTAACPQFSYTPGQSAFVVQQLIDAGAIPIGKTNMDQFATGLTGTRSPYGAVKNSINPDYISGGSSSGSAVATALGLVSFALGTDTAGSGRVPAMFNNLIGVKPSCGIVSTRGVVPACRSLDCVSLFALNPDDAARIYPLMARYDDMDSYARKAEPVHAIIQPGFSFGVVAEEQLQLASAPEVRGLMEQMSSRLIALGGTPVQIDFTPFLQAGSLLYEGPWVAERYAAIEPLIKNSPEILHPVTRTIISRADKFTAADTFHAMYHLRDLKLLADKILSGLDFILTPTASSIFTIKAVENDPIGLNTLLGYYTNFVNLLDYSAIALPAGRLANGLPFGVTLFADKFHDDYLIRMARRILAQSGLSMGATGISWIPADSSSATQDDKDRVNLLVCGAHLTGMPLNHQLINLDAQLVQSTTTAPSYRLYALAGGPPFRPGLVRDRNNGGPIAVEIWSIPVVNLGKFLQGIPAPLGLGKVELADNTEVIGFICEPYAVSTATDITGYGGWVKYIQTLKS